MAASDSALRAVEKAAGVDDDDVGAGVLARQFIPSARSRVMMRSVSTSAFGQPSETKLTFGAVLPSLTAVGRVGVSSMRQEPAAYKRPR